MAVEAIDQIIDREAIEAQKAFFVAALKEMQQSVVDVQNLRITMKGSDLGNLPQTIENLNKGMASSDVAIQKVTKSYDDLATITERVTKRVSEQNGQSKEITQQILIEAKSTKELAAAKLIEEKTRIANEAAARKEQSASQKLTAEQKLQKQVIESAEGSYKKLDAQLKLLLIDYKKLSDIERNSSTGKELQSHIQSTTNSLKSMDAGLGNHQRNVGNYTKSIGDGFEHVATRALQYLAAYAGFDAIKSFFQDSIAEALEAEKANIRFQSTLETLGRSDTFERLTQKAKDMAAQFKYLDNDAIVGVFEKLVTYGKLTETEINNLTPIIINYAAKSGKSIEESTDVIIGAIEGQAKALKTLGISVKDAKTDSERLGIVMTDLGKRVEGAADAFGETTAGKIAVTQQHFKDLKEEVGNGLLPVLNKLLEGVNGLLTGFQHMADDGIDKVLEKTNRGITTYLFQGAEAFKKLQKAREDFYKGLTEIDPETGKIVAQLTQPADTVVDPNANKTFGGEKNDSDKEGLKHAEDAAKKLAQINEDSRRRIAEYYKKRLEDLAKATEDEIKSEIDKYKREYSDQEKSELERLASLQNFYDLSRTLNEKEKQRELSQNDLQAQSEIEKAKKSGVTGQQLAKELLAIENKRVAAQTLIIQDANNKFLGLDRDFATDTIAIVKDGFTKEEKELEEHVAKMAALRKAKIQDKTDTVDIEANTAVTEEIQNAQTEITKSHGKKREDLERASQDKIIEIDKKAELEKLKISDEELQHELANLLLLEASTKDVEKRITENKRKEAEIQKGIDDAKKKAAKDARDEDLEEAKKYSEAVIDVAETFGDAGFENKKNQIQKEIEANDEKTRKDIEAVNASTRSEQDKAAAITIIQARAQAEKEALVIRQKKIDYDKAKFDKAISIITVLAAIAVDLAKANFAAAAAGGAALIKLIATPIPRYKYGRTEGKSELAIVGDGGVHEYIQRKDGSIEKTPAVDTLTHLMPEDKVYSNKQAMMKELALSAIPLSDYHVNKSGGIDKADMKAFTSEIVGAVGEIKIHTQMITKDGWRNHNERLADYDKWVNKYIKN